jgi:hypothetical protein
MTLQLASATIDYWRKSVIKQIRIRNFRNLLDVTVDLDPLTVLIGRSGTGKSNFIRAIRFLRDCLSARAVNFNQPAATPSVFHAEHGNAPLAFDVAFEIKGLGREFSYTMEFDPTKGQYGERLLAGGVTLFHQSGGKWIDPPKVSSPPTPNGIVLGAVPGLQESTLAYVALRSGIGCYDFPGNVLTGSQVRSGPADAGLSDGGENYLVIADRIISDLSRSQSWRRITKSLRAINSLVASLTPSVPEPNRIDVGHQLNGRILSMDARLESEGFRRYLAHLLALYQVPPKQTLLFEHPESGLHPAALDALADEFRECPADGRGQVILTTHSPQLLDYFPVDAVRVVEIDNLRTKIGPLAPEQAAAVRQQLLYPGELLTVDHARLEGQLDGVPG